MRAIDAQVLVATYEKAIGLLLSGQIRPGNALVVADELQILCDKSRGPDIETLCAILKQRGTRQFVALTATVENSEDLAGWMECTLVRSPIRSTPLHQEIWFKNLVYSVTYGQELGTESSVAIADSDLNEILTTLLAQNKGPILVFTETRKEAARYAEEFTSGRIRTTSGIDLALQLELFSEPTESSDRLKSLAERCVTFHTADLSAQERQVLEEGFTKSQFDVCFATSTLAAGVNFPFRTIVFPKLTYQYREIGERLSLSDYRNMSGRAGRLGLHDSGYAVLLPKDTVEAAYAQKLILPKNERLDSVLLTLSLRKTLLSLIASQAANSASSIDAFFESTLYSYQTLNSNPTKLSRLKDLSREAVQWLASNNFIQQEGEELHVTSLGKATARSGLLPDTAAEFAALLNSNRESLLKGFDSFSEALIYAACASMEFKAERPSRFLPYTGNEVYTAMDFWRSRAMLVKLDTADYRTAQCAQAVAIYMTGESERRIAHFTGVSSGSLQRLAADVSWILEGLQIISAVPEIGCPQGVSNNIDLLSRRVRWGVPSETLDLLRVAERHRVPGVGRQRAMELIRRGFQTLEEVLQAGTQKLLDVLKNPLRVKALQESISAMKGHGGNRLESAHIRVAEDLGIRPLIERCYSAIGTAYEDAIVAFVQQVNTFRVRVVDDARRQNVPDILISVGNTEALIECKTAVKSPSLINKEDAWAVMQKAADFDVQIHRVTLGKPAFDETSKKKAAASGNITLVEHSVFIEALLRVLQGSLSGEDFMTWLVTPGVAQFERIPGEITYSK